MTIKNIRFLTVLQLGIGFACVASSTSHAASFGMFPNAQSDQLILKMETRGIPAFLAKKAFQSYTEAYNALKRCDAFQNDPKLANARRGILRLMERGNLVVESDGFDNSCTDHDFGIPQLILHGSQGEKVCYRIRESDRGGAYLRLPFLPHMTLTPLTFSEMDGKLSWILLEYLLDRNTDRKPGETQELAKSCFTKARSRSLSFPNYQ